LEWAAQSSREYFQLRHLQESEAVITGLNSLKGECHGTEAVEHLLLPLGGTNGEHADADSVSRSSPRPGPAMEVISPSTLLIESSAGATALKQATVT
ncbi:unnamed protein product, partial [Ectocarpus sp. 12 AP-2014]